MPITRSMANDIQAQIHNHLNQLDQRMRDNFDTLENNVAQISNQNRRFTSYIEPFIPETDDFPRWLAQIEQLMTELNYEEGEQRKAFLIRSIGRVAREAIYACDVDNNLTYANLIPLLTTRFARRAGTLSRKRELELIKQKEGETLDKYGDRLKLLVSLAYPNTTPVFREEMALSKFIVTVQPIFLRERLAMQNVQTVYEAVVFAKDLLEARKNTQTEIAQINSVSEDRITSILEKLVDSLDSLKQQNRDNRNKFCAYCRRPGHHISECRDKARNHCFKCNRYGHRASECRTNNNNSYQNSGNRNFNSNQQNYRPRFNQNQFNLRNNYRPENIGQQQNYQPFNTNFRQPQGEATGVPTSGPGRYPSNTTQGLRQ